MRIDRREMRALLATGPLSGAGIPIRAFTSGPKFHWFGYCDKLRFHPSGRYVLAMESDFENRSLAPGDTIPTGMVDTRDNNWWVELGTSRAWC